MNPQNAPVGAAGARKPVVKFLVVCGVKAVDDSWFFGNFVGFCRALQRVGFTGDFWSSFPIRQYFQQQGDNIKFGRTDKHDWTPIDIYTEQEWRTFKPFWTDYPPNKHADMVPDVLQYLAHASVHLVKDDHLTIILCGHGNDDGTRLGSEMIGDNEMVSAFQRFKPGVQVNLVVQACNPGIFVDKLSITNQKLRYAHASTSAQDPSYPDDRSPSNRYRNSVFSGAFLQGLRIGFDANRSAWTLGGHIAHVAREGKDDPNNPDNIATPQYYTDQALYTNFTDVLFTEFIDRNFQAAPVARRILTPTIQESAAPSGPRPTMSRETMDLAIESIERELSRAPNHSAKDAALGSALGRYQYLLHNGNIDQKIFSTAIADLMRALKWRLKIQENFYLALEGLTSKGLVNPDVALNPNAPIMWNSWPDWLIAILRLLRCFSVADECGSSGPDVRFQGHFDAPLVWLAWIIGQSCTDLAGVLEYLRKTRLLGKVDSERLRSKAPPFIDVSDVEMSSSKTISRPKQPQIGFWLPQDAGSMGDFWNEWHTRYHQFRLIYDEFFGVGAWGDYEAVTQILGKWR